MVDLSQLLSWVAAILGGGGAIAVIAKTLIDKYGKGTNERQTEVALGVSILEKQIARADEDKKGWKEIETFLRAELSKADTDKRELRKLLETAEDRIRVLENERDALINRLKLLAAKFARGEVITLADITGQEGLEQELEDLEDTYMS